MSDRPRFSLEELSESLTQLPLWGKALLAGGVAALSYLPYTWIRTKSRSSPLKTDYTPGVVYLYQFSRTKNLPSISSSCLELETWLRMAEITYENVAVGSNRSLDGTVPFIELDGKEVSHTPLAIQHIKQSVNKSTIDDHLSDEQRATCHAFTKLVQLSLESSHLIYRIENADKMLALVPSFNILSQILSIFVQRSGIDQSSIAANYNQFPRQQAIDLGKDDIRALSKYLSSKHFFTGFKPASIDATIFAVLAQIVHAPYTSEHADLIKGECSNLLQFVDRMKARFWPDWKDATTKFTMESQWKRKPGTPNTDRSLTPTTAKERSITPTIPKLD